MLQMLIILAIFSNKTLNINYYNVVEEMTIYKSTSPTSIIFNIEDIYHGCVLDYRQ